MADGHVVPELKGRVKTEYADGGGRPSRQLMTMKNKEKEGTKEPRATATYIPFDCLPPPQPPSLKCFWSSIPIGEFLWQPWGKTSMTCLNLSEIRHLASTECWYELLAKLQEILREHMLFSLKYSFFPWVISSLIPQLHTSTDLLDSVLKKEDNPDFQVRRANNNRSYFGENQGSSVCVEW